MLTMKFAPFLALVLTGCGSTEDQSIFCSAIDRVNDDVSERVNADKLYMSGDYMHGAIVFDRSCPRVITAVNLDFGPIDKSTPAMRRIDEFWNSYFAKPKSSGGIFVINAAVEIRVVDSEKKVSIRDVYQYSEVSVKEGEEVRGLMAEAR